MASKKGSYDDKFKLRTTKMYVKTADKVKILAVMQGQTMREYLEKIIDVEYTKAGL